MSMLFRDDYFNYQRTTIQTSIGLQSFKLIQPLAISKSKNASNIPHTFWVIDSQFENYYVMLQTQTCAYMFVTLTYETTCMQQTHRYVHAYSHIVAEIRLITNYFKRTHAKIVVS